MNLLVTGATGHSGKLFLESLNNKPAKYDEVHVVTRKYTKIEFSDLTNLNIIQHVGDLQDEEFVNQITQNIDTVLHIAGIQMSRNIFNSAIKNKVDWVIAVHTTGRYSKFKSASAEYIEIEDDLLKHRDKINMTILRPTMIYGSVRDRNMYRLIKFIDKYPIFPIFGNGNNLMQPVSGRDLAKAYLSVIENKDITVNKTYNLSGRYPIKYKNLIKTIAEKLDKNIKLIKVPIFLSYYGVLFAEKIIPRFPLNEEQILRMKEDKDFTHIAAQKDFGYDPESFEEGIELEINEYRGEK